MKRFRLILLAGAALALSIAAVASAAQARHGVLAVKHARVGAPTALTGYTSAPELAVQQGSYKLGAATNPGFVLFSDPTNDATAKIDRKSTRLNSSHTDISRMPSSA